MSSSLRSRDCAARRPGGTSIAVGAEVRILRPGVLANRLGVVITARSGYYQVRLNAPGSAPKELSEANGDRSGDGNGDLQAQGGCSENGNGGGGSNGKGGGGVVGGGGEGGEGGVGGEGGGGGTTTKVALPVLPPSRLKLWSVHAGADHSLPFHPSPYESYMLSVQLPGGTAWVAE